MLKRSYVPPNNRSIMSGSCAVEVTTKKKEPLQSCYFQHIKGNIFKKLFILKNFWSQGAAAHQSVVFMYTVIQMHTLPPLLRLQNKNQHFISPWFLNTKTLGHHVSEMRQMRNKEVNPFFFVYDKSKREKPRLLFDFLIYKHVKLHGWSVFLIYWFFLINLWSRNVTRNARDVHRCQVNVQLCCLLGFFSCPPLAEFSLPNSWNVFYIYLVLLSEVYRGTQGTLTDWLTAWKLANVHMHDNLIQISKTFMDLFRRDSTW